MCEGNKIKNNSNKKPQEKSPGSNISLAYFKI